MTEQTIWNYVMLFGITLLVIGAQCEEKTEVFAAAGSQAVLPCVSQHPAPSAATIHWSRNNGDSTVWRKQRSGLEYTSQGLIKRVSCPQVGRGDYSLHIEQVKAEDGGEYTCQVENRMRLVNKVVSLTVIKVTFSPPAPMEGDNVSIGCNIRPLPMGATMSWRFNGKPFVPQDPNQAQWTGILDANKVMVEKASQHLAGEWTCVVGSWKTEGKAGQTLAVRGIVEPARDDASVYAAVGSLATLPCVFSHGLAVSNATWERLEESFLPPFHSLPFPPTWSLSSMSHHGPWDRSLRVGEVRPEDGGRYRCSGMAEGHKLIREFKLITAQVHSSTMASKGAPVTLTCHLSDITEVTGYEWVRLTYDFNGTQSVSSVHTGKDLRIPTASATNSGEWMCRFYGERGILGNVTYSIPVMSDLTGDRGTAGPPSDAAAVIGLVFLILVLLLIVAQMYKNYQRKKRILQYPALETIVHSNSNEREERERNRKKDLEI
ncbi:basement membrane-specific heparan sulfate proteoglycan core protein [Aplochiton taeniatus]